VRQDAARQAETCLNSEPWNRRIERTRLPLL
jgi:hypothetical protein